MTTQKLVVKCAHGLQLRVASSVVGVARDHQATTVQLTCGNCRQAQGCSVLELLSLEASQGTPLEVVVNGPDETGVLSALAEIFENGDGI